jgi:hypothetical protein
MCDPAFGSGDIIDSGVEIESRETGVGDHDVYEFILENIDSVPHLEALLLVWNSRPRALSESEIAERLFVNAHGARSIMADLARRGLAVAAEPDRHAYRSSTKNDPIMEALAEIYRTDLVLVSTLIHSKISPGVREFARAFELKRKEKKS